MLVNLLRRYAKSREGKCTSFSTNDENVRLRCSLYFSLFLLCLPPAASAEVYSWRNPFGGPLSFSSAESACRYNDGRPWGPGKWVFVKMALMKTKYPQYPEFACYFNSLNWDGSPGITGDYVAGYTSRDGDTCSAGLVYNPTTGGCALDESKGLPTSSLSCNNSPSGLVGDPINTANGNSFQVETDYAGSGVFPLDFTRTYNSIDGLWRHKYSTFLRLAGTTYLSLVMADGRESFFVVSGTTVTASPAELGQLVKLTDGWQYTAKDNEHFIFDAAGRLTRWINASGLEQQLSYSGSTVTVTDTLGHSLSFTEDTNHQPLSLAATDLQISYSYNVHKRLTQLTRTQSGQTKQRSFHYEDVRNPNWLTGITDERGVRFATWTFDDQGRATSSEHAGGIERTDVVYNADGSSTVTNVLGKKTIYRFQTIAGIKRVSAIEGEPSAGCPMSNSIFTYDSRGLLNTKTDNRGGVTSYSYNTRGLEITRTEASGTPQSRTTSTTWHATFNLPLTITEPGRITIYTYDAQGRQLSQTSASAAL